MVGAAAGAGGEARTAAAFKEGVPSDMEVWSRRSNPSVQGPVGATRGRGSIYHMRSGIFSTRRAGGKVRGNTAWAVLWPPCLREKLPL